MDPRARKAQVLIVSWTMGLFLLGWLVALVLLPEVDEIPMVGAVTFLFMAVVLELPLLVQMGRISRRTYLVVRVSLAPMFLVLILLRDFLNR